uniref:Uncharacterized protein n=1 Tax=Brassica oleracea TaxID=3712 RepID=A0A3P6FJK2_BRAOL|nr:unnamed protein product [Brassica oleracea]
MILLPLFPSNLRSSEPILSRLLNRWKMMLLAKSSKNNLRLQVKFSWPIFSFFFGCYYPTLGLRCYSAGVVVIGSVIGAGGATVHPKEMLLRFSFHLSTLIHHLLLLQLRLPDDPTAAFPEQPKKLRADFVKAAKQFKALVASLPLSDGGEESQLRRVAEFQII